MTAAERLAAAWRELEADALASDRPIRDRDVRDAIKRNRARIEAAARESMTQDELDGAALHRLREALPVNWEAVPRLTRNEVAIEVWGTGGNSYFEPPQPDIYKRGATISEAADACREAIEAWAIEAQR